MPLCRGSGRGWELILERTTAVTRSLVDKAMYGGAYGKLARVMNDVDLGKRMKKSRWGCQCRG